MGDRETAIFDASKAYSPVSIGASQTAVLLMDYQNMIIGMAGASGPKTVGVASQLRDWALGEGMSVFHCMIDFHATPGPQSKMAERAGGLGGLLEQNPTIGDEAAALAPSAASENETVVKRTPGIVSTLYSTDLAEELKKRNVSSLILAGLSSSGCVLSTTRDATDRGFVVTVVSDACADREQSLHDLLMRETLPMTAHTASLQEIQAAWKTKA